MAVAGTEKSWLEMYVLYSSDPSTLGVEARPGVQGHLWLHSKFEASLGYVSLISK